MFQKIAKHRANDASKDVHRPPLPPLDRRDYQDHHDRNLIQQVALRHLHLSKPLDLLRT